MPDSLNLKNDVELLVELEVIQVDVAHEELPCNTSIGEDNH